MAGLYLLPDGYPLYTLHFIHFMVVIDLIFVIVVIFTSIRDGLFILRISVTTLPTRASVAPQRPVKLGPVYPADAHVVYR
jgi:hypothetical protein